MQPELKNRILAQLSQIFMLFRYLGWRSLSQKANILLTSCLFFSALAASGLAYFSAGAQTALNKDISTFLGAPLVIRSDQPLLGQWWQGSTIADPVETVSLTHGANGLGGYHSIALKGVASTYPLQGEIKLRNSDGPFTSTGENLIHSNAWLDARAMVALGVDLGDQIQIGEVSFTVTAQVVFEPDRLTQLQHILPRVMVHLEDLMSIGLDLNNGRNEFRYLFAAEDSILQEFESSLPSILKLDYQVLKPEKGQHPFSRLAQRADKMLGMVLVFVLLLCGAAATILVNFSIQKYVLPGTMLRCMGIKRSVFSSALLLQLILMALVSGVLGGIAGWLIQPWLKDLLMPHLMLADITLSWQISLTTLGITLLALTAFVYPRLVALSLMPVSGVLRGQAITDKNYFISILSALFCVALLLWYNSDNMRLTLFLSLGVVVLVVLTLAFGWLLSRSTGLLHYFNQGILRVALRSIGRSPKKHITVMATIALASMALLMTANLRGNFLDRYHVQLLSHDGNYFFSGLPAKQRSEFIRLMQKNKIPIKGSYPTVSAKLFSINGQEIDQVLTAESDTREEIRSPVRLSWSKDAPKNNTMLSGVWPKLGSSEVSVEAEVMSDLGLKMGDVLGFKIGNEVLESKISSKRAFKSGSSMVMFWFMFAPDTLSDYAQHDMGGIEVQADNKQILSSIAYEFPAVLITDIAQQVSNMRAIMISITKIMNSILMLLVLASLTVLLASAYTSLHSQHKRINLMRAMGVIKSKIYIILLIEQAVVGFVASLIGVLGAQLIANLMFKQQFGISYTPDWVGLGLLITIVTGVFALMGLIIAYYRIKQPIQLFQQT
ncbi:MAG: FtsX-like permease family protein [Xanthomonadales bacterium]|nr:FtsX-like permease family protein [Xanthomonadales bacterium]